eukprot:SAG11_NODE_37090_length_258_cov_0.981132_1_plen_70_part_10
MHADRTGADSAELQPHPSTPRRIFDSLRRSAGSAFGFGEADFPRFKEAVTKLKINVAELVGLRESCIRHH